MTDQLTLTTRDVRVVDGALTEIEDALAAIDKAKDLDAADAAAEPIAGAVEAVRKIVTGPASEAKTENEMSVDERVKRQAGGVR